METLTLKELKKIITSIEKEYGKQAEEFPIIIGNDEELNGMHEAYFMQPITKKDPQYDLYKLVDYDGLLKNDIVLIS